jgi:hypothetical protein
MSGPDREIIIELQRLDGYVRICAVDVATGTEVIAVGSAKATERDLQELGVRKLNAVLNRSKSGSDEQKPTPPKSDRGRLV